MIMKKYLIFVFTVLFSFSAFAVDDGDYWLQRQVSIGDGKTKYAKRVYGQYAKTVMEDAPSLDGSKKESVKAMIERSIAVDKPTPSKVGGAMMKRLTASLKAPGVQMLGVYAVTELLEAIGWVMKDGAYVKLKQPDPQQPPELSDFKYYPIAKLSGDLADLETRKSEFKSRFPIRGASIYGTDFVGFDWSKSTYKITGNTISLTIHADTKLCQVNCYPSPNYEYSSNASSQKVYLSGVYNGPSPEPEKIPLTAPVLGAIMLGQGYTDPVGDKNAENVVNDGDYTGVVGVYNHDPSGTGNEVAEALDEKAKNAKPTPDGKPAPLGDPRYDDGGEIVEDDTSKDRKWDEDGDTATGGIQPETDPVTGDKTGNQSISLQFPIFCTWAFKMCQWYDDWKKSDQVYKDHMTKTEEHQSDEKTFWEKVTDFFDWTKEDKDDNDQDDEEPDTSTLDKKFDTDFSANGSCPPNPAIEFPLVGTVELPFSKICDFFSFLRFGVLTGASLLACWIIASAVKGET